ncbi:MAG: ROK family protein [Saprospiraceae bacterium]
MNILGLDVGGTSIKIGRYDARGTELSTERIRTDAWRGKFVERLLDYLQNTATFDAAGIGLPGMITRDRSTPIMIEAIRELDDINLLEKLQRQFPKATFKLENDAMCAALGLRHATPELGESYLYIGFGTGLASASIMDGAPFLGPNGNALELGFVPMADGGHFEGNVGVQGLLRKYKSLGNNEVSPHKLCDFLNDGSAQSAEVLDYMSGQLKQVLAQAVLSLDLRAIAFGGGNAPRSSAFYETLRQNLCAVLPPYYHDLRLVRVEASPFMAARGAAMLVS